MKHHLYNVKSVEQGKKFSDFLFHFPDETMTTSLSLLFYVNENRFPFHISILQEPENRFLRCFLSQLSHLFAQIDKWYMFCFSSLNFVFYVSLFFCVCKNRGKTQIPSPKIALQMKKVFLTRQSSKRNRSFKWMFTVLLLLQINWTNKDMHDCNNSSFFFVVRKCTVRDCKHIQAQHNEKIQDETRGILLLIYRKYSIVSRGWVSTGHFSLSRYKQSTENWTRIHALNSTVAKVRMVFPQEA